MIKMRTYEIAERLQKAEEKVQKIHKTIERHGKRAEKILKIIRDHGWDETNPWCKADTDEHNEAYWTICDFNSAEEDIVNSKKKLKDAERIAEDWKIKFDDQKKKEDILKYELPEIFRQCQKDLTEAWTQHDIESREKMFELKRSTTYSEFSKVYGRSAFERLNRSDDEFRKENLESSEAFLIDLHDRVKAVTGNVTDWNGIHYGGKALNGVVIGENATVEVETILAGGYNIQRLHNRVIVKKIK